MSLFYVLYDWNHVCVGKESPARRMEYNKPLWLTYEEKEKLAQLLWHGLKAEKWEQQLNRSRGPLHIIKTENKWELKTLKGSYYGSTREIIHLLGDLVRPEFTSVGTHYRKQGIVLAAPHGEFDWNSEKIVSTLSRKLKIPAVIASRFRFPADFEHPEIMPLYVNVNRPTENKELKGNYTREVITSRAGHVYHTYQQSLFKAAGIQQPPLLLHIEIHCHRRDNSVQIATVGINDASRIKRRFEAALNPDENSEAPVTILMEPDDVVYWKAGNAKKFGAFRPEMARRGLHVELPEMLTQNKAWERTASSLVEIFSEVLGNMDDFF